MWLAMTSNLVTKLFLPELTFKGSPTKLQILLFSRKAKANYSTQIKLSRTLTGQIPIPIPVKNLPWHSVLRDNNTNDY